MSDCRQQQELQEYREQAVIEALQECLDKNVSSHSMAVLMCECDKHPTQLNYSKEIMT